MDVLFSCTSSMDLKHKMKWNMNSMKLRSLPGGKIYIIGLLTVIV